MKGFLSFFENFYTDFLDTWYTTDFKFGLTVLKIGSMQILVNWTGLIIKKNNQLACFLGSPCTRDFFPIRYKFHCNWKSYWINWFWISWKPFKEEVIWSWGHPIFYLNNTRTTLSILRYYSVLYNCQFPLVSRHVWFINQAYVPDLWGILKRITHFVLSEAQCF